MALTIGEAQAVNDLVAFALRHSRCGHEQPVDVDSRGRAAAVLLADKAHRPLMAGFTGDDVRRQWPPVARCPHGRSIASRRQAPCPGPLLACVVD